MSTTRVRDHVAVRCPIAQAQARLEAFLARDRSSDGTTRLELCVPLTGLDGLPGLALQHPVTVMAQHARDDENLNDLVRISWEPEGGGPFPAFSGTLVTWAEDDPQRSFIEINGTYSPPLGAFGAAFDAAVGRAIAQRTVHEFLEEIARAISDPS